MQVEQLQTMLEERHTAQYHVVNLPLGWEYPRETGVNAQ
jgi:hypothetical protein